MPFQVFIRHYADQEPTAVSGFISGKSTVRLMGSYISGKRAAGTICQVFAVGQRYGWIYSQRELRDHLDMNTRIGNLKRAVQNLPI